MADYEALKLKVQELAESIEKFSILPGIGARLAAEIIIESMKP